MPFDPNDRSRINVYCSPSEDGGVNIDGEAIAFDLIMTLKLKGVTRAEFQSHIMEMWDDIEVTVLPRIEDTN